MSNVSDGDRVEEMDFDITLADDDPETEELDIELPEDAVVSTGATSGSTWYDNRTVVIGLFVSLFVFEFTVPFLVIIVTPIAIFAMWKSGQFLKRTKQIVIGLFGTLCLLGLLAMGTEESISDRDAGFQSTENCSYFNSGDGVSARLCD